MNYLVDGVVAVLVLGVLIFVHELGHFLLAKWCGVGVLDFSIGFGKTLISKKVGETTYSIRLIPLGGFVRMVGDDIRQVSGELAEESFEDSQDVLDEQDRRLMSDRSRWFLAKGFWPKAAIVIAGPAFNLIFALIVSIASFYIFGKVLPGSDTVIGGVIPGLPAEKAGFEAGDKVLSIDGKKVTTFDEIAKIVFESEGQEMKFVVTRKSPADGNGNIQDPITIAVAGTNETTELDVIEGRSPDGFYRIGISRSESELREPLGLVESLEFGSWYTLRLMDLTVRGMYLLVAGHISTNNIAGPIVIMSEAAKSANKGLEDLLRFMAFLSVSLAILNLLPIPILDGGHLLFFIVEALKGSPVSLRVHEFANQVGMLLLLLLMAFALSNDVIKVVSS